MAGKLDQLGEIPLDVFQIICGTVLEEDHEEKCHDRHEGDPDGEG